MYSFLFSQKVRFIDLIYESVSKHYNIMLTIFLTLLIAIFAWLGYKYIQLRRNFSNYAQILQQSGYHVSIRPFGLLTPAFVKDRAEGYKNHGDAYHLRKTELRGVDLTLSNVFDKVVVCLSNPDLLKQFFSPDKLPIYEKEKIMIEGIKAIFGEGIVFSQGHTWKNKRKIFSKVFNFELLKGNIPKITQVCDRTFDIYEKTNKTGQNQFSYFVLEWNTCVLISVMLQCFFGSDYVNQQIKGLSFQQFIMNLMGDANKISASVPMMVLGKTAYKYGMTAKIREVKENIKILRTIASEMIKRRSEEISKGNISNNPSDIIAALHRQKERVENSGENPDFQYTEEDLIDEFCTFLVAGTDTTSHMLMMMIYYVCDHPQIEAKLRKQIDQVIQSDEDYTYESLKKLVYIDWIENQTTRIYGPGTLIFMRKALKDHMIGSIPITKGTSVCMESICNHYSEKYFKKPTQFRPERWESECDNLHPFAFIGFSGGQRTCLGKHLAYLESKIILIKMFKRYKSISVLKNRKMNISFIYEPEPFKTIFTK